LGRFSFRKAILSRHTNAVVDDNIGFSRPV